MDPILNIHRLCWSTKIPKIFKRGQPIDYEARSFCCRTTIKLLKFLAFHSPTPCPLIDTVSSPLLILHYRTQPLFQFQSQLRMPKFSSRISTGMT
ncbi:hypothetical protein BKA69DRAFT_148702 [Paraphysoderma sedebokerense]|nr:hypothetical protein BKA69DRAFT_148702 [Paraphysoderma sedebokerense]